MIRGDVSSRVIHLTPGNGEMTAEQVFGRIVNEGKLNGSKRDIRGGYSCVCDRSKHSSPIHRLHSRDGTRPQRGLSCDGGDHESALRMEEGHSLRYD
jgi:hypothetical protein